MNTNPRFESWSASATPAPSLRRFWHRPARTTRPTWSDLPKKPEDGEMIQIIAQAIIALIAVCALIWAIGQATAAQDRALTAHAQVQP